MVLVSHRLDELFDMCDSLTVLRDGVTVAEGPLDDFTPDAVIDAMIGRHRAQAVTRIGGTPRADQPPALVVEQLSSPRALHEVSLSVRPGRSSGLRVRSAQGGASFSNASSVPGSCRPAISQSAVRHTCRRTRLRRSGQGWPSSRPTARAKDWCCRVPSDRT